MSGLALPEQSARGRYDAQILDLILQAPQAITCSSLTAVAETTTESPLTFWAKPHYAPESRPATWDSILNALRWNTVVSSIAAVITHEHDRSLTWSQGQENAWRDLFLADPEPIRPLSFLVQYQDALFLTWWTRHVVWHLNVSASEMDDEALLLEIAGRFAKYQRVEAVYQLRYQDEMQITVAINTQRYEPELLERLLEDEYEIRLLAGARVLSFTYPPTGVVPRQDIVHPKARLLYLK